MRWILVPTMPHLPQRTPRVSHAASSVCTWELIVLGVLTAAFDRTLNQRAVGSMRTDEG